MRAEEAIEVLDKLFTYLGSYRCEHDECRNCSLCSPTNRKRDALDRAIEALERNVPVSTDLMHTHERSRQQCGDLFG